MGTARELTILLADDHGIVREGIAGLCRGEAGYRVVAQCPDGEEALAAILSMQPDFALLDLNMPRLNGLEVVRRVRTAGIATKLIVLSITREENLVRELLRSGADGYILKDGPARHIFDAMNYVLDGGKYITPLLQVDLVENKSDSDDPMALLSRREYEVFGFLIEGVRPKDIAKRLGLSPKTVDTYRANIMRKMGVDGIAGLVRLTLNRSRALSPPPTPPG